MSVYPIIKLPRPIKQAYAVESYVPLFDPQPMLEKNPTVAVPQQLALRLLAIEAAILTMLAGSLGLLGQGIVGLGLWLLGIGLVFFQASYMKKSYAQRWRRYREQTELLQRQQWEQEFEMARWERLQTPDGIAKFRRRKIGELLASSLVASDIEKETSLLEEQLGIALHQYFPHHTQLGKGSGLMLIDRQSGLHISIIIDTQPQPVAGVAAGSFIEDDLYLDRCWVVARFTAEQVDRAVDSCCKAVAEVCAELLQNNNWLQPFAQVPDLWAMEKLSNSSSNPIRSAEYSSAKLPI
jgi:hypothetical protein